MTIETCLEPACAYQGFDAKSVPPHISLQLDNEKPITDVIPIKGIQSPVDPGT